MELTLYQIERQDFVNNAIYRFIQTINPSLDKEIDWDIEMIGDIRDTLNEWFIYRLKITEEQEFYLRLEEGGGH